MGCLTTITILNDAQHSFEEDPKAFGEAVLNGVDRANMEHKAVSASFKGYANYITVQHPRHADDPAVYVHHGNTVLCVSGYEKDFKEFMERDPAGALRFAEIAVNHAQEVRRLCKQKIKERLASGAKV